MSGRDLEDLPTPDIATEDKLESAASTFLRQQHYEYLLVMHDYTMGNPRITTGQANMAKYLFERVAGPLKAPAGDWVEDLLKDMRNLPTNDETKLD